MEEYIVGVYDTEYSEMSIHRIKASSGESAVFGAVHDLLEEYIKSDRMDVDERDTILDKIVAENTEDSIATLEDWGFVVSVPELL